MIATIMQARRMSFLKTHLNAIFKGNKSRHSITLNIKSSQYLEGNFAHIHTHTRTHIFHYIIVINVIFSLHIYI